MNYLHFCGMTCLRIHPTPSPESHPAAARGICGDHQQTTAHMSHHRWALPVGLMSTENLGMPWMGIPCWDIAISRDITQQ